MRVLIGWVSLLFCLSVLSPTTGGDEDWGSVRGLGWNTHWTGSCVPTYPVSTSRSVFLRRRARARDRPPISSGKGGRGAFKKLGKERLQELLKRWKIPVLPPGRRLENGLNSIIFLPVLVLLGILSPITESHRCWGPLSRNHSVHSPASSQFSRTCQSTDEGNTLIASILGFW